MVLRSCYDVIYYKFIPITTAVSKAWAVIQDLVYEYAYTNQASILVE